MANKCIGIISYLPNKWNTRINRLIRLSSLINKCNDLFGLPIILIAQNYKDEDFNKLDISNLIIKKYSNPLGIALARDTLRKEFLLTNYDAIILFDDDCELVGNNASSFLKQIDENPNKILHRGRALHKLMVIYRSVYEKNSYDLVNTPDALIAYEDRLFFYTFAGLHPELTYKFSDININEKSTNLLDKNSSWSSNVSKDKQIEMSKFTDKLIENRTNKTINEIYNLIGFKTYKTIEVDE